MNITDQLTRCLSQGQHATLEMLGQASESIGVKIFLVGGSVRDIMLNRPFTDLDVSVECKPESIIKTLPSHRVKVKSTSLFGTAKLLVDHYIVDMAMSRAESYPVPGQLPEVFRSDIRDDLRRRDFTVNAMAVSLNPKTWGELLDLYGGIDDINARLIRIIEVDSFVKDPTRIFRAARYSCRLNFKLDVKARRLVEENHEAIKGLSGTRIANEFRSIFNEPNPYIVLNVLEKWKVLADVSSGLTLGNRLCEIMGSEWCPSHDRAVLGFVLLSIPLSESDRTVFFRRLNLDKKLIIAIQSVAEIEALRECTCRGQIYEVLSNQSKLAMEAVSSYDEGQLEKHIELFQSELSELNVEVSGDDLLLMGIQEGPEMGRIIKAVRNAVIAGNISTREEQIEFAKKLVVND